MSTSSTSGPYSKRKPIPSIDKDYGNGGNNGNNNKPIGDLSFLNQAPKTPAKSPLRTSGPSNASTNNLPITGSTQTTIVQPVISTMTITSTTQPATIIKPQSPSSVDTNSTNSYQSRERDLPAAPLSPDSGSDYEESAKSIK